MCTRYVFLALMAVALVTISPPAHADTYADVDFNALLNEEIVSSASQNSDLSLPGANIPGPQMGAEAAGAADFSSSGLPPSTRLTSTATIFSSEFWGLPLPPPPTCFFFNSCLDPDPDPTTPSPTPEPSSMMLAVLGLLATITFAVMRKKRMGGREMRSVCVRDDGLHGFSIERTVEVRSH
jgi:hypothetical protein